MVDAHAATAGVEVARPHFAPDDRAAKTDAATHVVGVTAHLVVLDVAPARTGNTATLIDHKVVVAASIAGAAAIEV